ncbi:MAG: hypothetical protein U9Q81_20180 [Pseudomonadota bacterium]|nr:hypothetical protein [Pseudomonadota bacterium]
MGKILIPASSPEDWKQFLAEPEKHWKRGNSARALAYCWQRSDGIPSDVSYVLRQAPELRGLEAIFAIPEYRVPLPGGSRPSQSDIWVLGKTDRGIASIAVEGKVSESFGPTIGEWYEGASPGKEERLSFLCSELGLSFPPVRDLRYQLFHRTASAIIEAKRLRAPDAVMVVHTFSPSNEWFADYEAFLGEFGLRAGVNDIASKQIAANLCLHLAWVHGSEEFLQA